MAYYIEGSHYRLAELYLHIEMGEYLRDVHHTMSGFKKNIQRLSKEYSDMCGESTPETSYGFKIWLCHCVEQQQLHLLEQARLIVPYKFDPENLVDRIYRGPRLDSYEIVKLASSAYKEEMD